MSVGSEVSRWKVGDQVSSLGLQRLICYGPLHMCQAQVFHSIEVLLWCELVRVSCGNWR